MRNHSYNPVPPVSCKYGAPLGRRSIAQGDGTERLYLRRIVLDSGGYDSGGAYWGFPNNLYWYGDSTGAIDSFLRAPSRDDAKRLILAEIPEATFYR
jgi:hypothetical protein